MGNKDKVDREEAPEGYEAVRSLGIGCCCCDFDDGDRCKRPHSSTSCMASERVDGRSVKFRRKEAK